MLETQLSEPKLARALRCLVAIGFGLGFVLASNALGMRSTASSAANLDLDRLLARVLDERDGVDPQVFHSIAAFGTEESLSALRRSARNLSNWKRVHAVYKAALVYRGELEADAIDWVAGVVMRPKDDTHMLASARALAGFNERAIEDLERVFARHRDRRVQEIVFQPLVPSRGQKGTAKAIESILEFGDLRDPEHRQAVLTALGGCTSPKIDKLLAKRLAAPDTPMLQREALILLLAERQGKAIGKALTKALDHDDEVIQVRAMEALADRGELSAIRKLQKLFTSESQLVAREAVVTLDLLEPDREGWEKTLLKLARSKVPGVRMGAANALVRVPGIESAQAIHQLFEDAQWTVRMEAYEAARERSATELRPLLEARLALETGRLRADLIRILNELKTPGSKAIPNTDVDGNPWPQFFGIPCETRRLGIIVDRSSSMGIGMKDPRWSGKTRMGAVAQELEKFIQELPRGYFFALAYYDSELHVQDMEGSNGTGSKLIEFVQGVRPGKGGMDLYAAASEGLSTYADTLLIVVDGNPTLGRVMDPGLFVERFEQEHRLNKVRIHTVSLGGELPILRNLAAATGGKYLSFQ